MSKPGEKLNSFHNLRLVNLSPSQIADTATHKCKLIETPKPLSKRRREGGKAAKFPVERHIACVCVCDWMQFFHHYEYYLIFPPWFPCCFLRLTVAPFFFVCVCLCSVFIHHFLLFSPVLFFIIIIPFRVWSNDVFLCSIHSLNAPSGIKQAQLVSSFTFAFCLNDKKRARGIPLSVCVCVRLFVLIFSALLLITWFEPTVLPKRKANERRKEEEEAATLLPTNLLTRRTKIELGKMHKRINEPMNEKRTTNHQHIPALSRLVSKWNAACVFVCLFTLTWFGGVVSSRPVPPCLFFNVHYQHAQCIWF